MKAAVSFKKNDVRVMDIRWRRSRKGRAVKIMYCGVLLHGPDIFHGTEARPRAEGR
jgi:hypothetical protein